MAGMTKPFATEVELCAAFLSAVPAEWTAFAETGGWDILLVRKADGFQIGIEAKLRMNAHVLTQSLERYGASDVVREGPDCRAVLVPWGDAGGFDTIAQYLGVTIIRVYGPGRLKHQSRFEPGLPDLDHRWSAREWQEWAPARRHDLPAYVPDVAAGAPSPTQLTEWKIGAIKIAVTLEKRGFLTRADFKHIGIDHRRWLPGGAGWLKIDRGVYRRGDWFPNFKAQHPRVYDEISADFEDWKSPEPTLPFLGEQMPLVPSSDPEPETTT